MQSESGFSPFVAGSWRAILIDLCTRLGKLGDRLNAMEMPVCANPMRKDIEELTSQVACFAG